MAHKPFAVSHRVEVTTRPPSSDIRVVSSNTKTEDDTAWHR
jgi:hypothetical protein